MKLSLRNVVNIFKINYPFKLYEDDALKANINSSELNVPYSFKGENSTGK